MWPRFIIRTYQARFHMIIECVCVWLISIGCLCPPWPSANIIEIIGLKNIYSHVLPVADDNDNNHDNTIYPLNTTGQSMCLCIPFFSPPYITWQ